jgi:dTMP kinase
MVLENFAVLEGVDGAGTTTQISLLKERVEKEAIGGIVFTEEPTRSATGAFIRNILSGKISVEPGTLAYLFAADRYEHLYGADGIVKAHAEGKLVVSDRYFFSSLAYQGPLCGNALPKKLNEDFPLPGRLFYFEINVDSALSRIADRPQKEIFETKTALLRTSAEYEKIIAGYERAGAMKTVRLDAALPAERIHDLIWDELFSDRL